MSTASPAPEQEPSKTVSIKCHKCGHETHLTRAKVAKLLSAFSRGTPKNFSKAEIKRRKERMAAARAKRWPDKPQK